MRMRSRWHALSCAVAWLLSAAAVQAQQATPSTPQSTPAQGAPASPAPTPPQPATVEQLPAVTVVEPTEPKPPKRKESAKKKPAAAKLAQTQPATTSPQSPLATSTQAFDAGRGQILTQSGTSTYVIDKQQLEALPESAQGSISKVILQAPGVTQDSFAGGQIHVRNEHANIGYRVNGIILPEGVSGFSQVLDSGFIGSLSLVTGALPAEYGLRTSGLIDITTRAGAFENGGSITFYGGQRATFTPSFEYGGTDGATQYFLTGRNLPRSGTQN